jgi:uncharacterized protein (TIGR03435 family)
MAGLIPLALSAQRAGPAGSTGAPAPVAFEAASVKQNPTAAAGSFVGRQPGGRFRAQNASLRELICFAYQLQSEQLRGGPSWVDADRWDVLATLKTIPTPRPPGSVDETILAMRALLADRFTLRARQDVQQLSAYVLRLARPDGAPGPQLTRSPFDCEALFAAANRGAPPPRPADGRPLCDVRGRVGSIQSGGLSLSLFANALADRLQRVVVDRTGLTGAWDLSLTYAPEPSQLPVGALPPPPDPTRPSLFTALQEQLGLKLESTHALVDVLVIESVERPSPD